MLIIIIYYYLLSTRRRPHRRAQPCTCATIVVRKVTQAMRKATQVQGDQLLLCPFYMINSLLLVLINLTVLHVLKHHPPNPSAPPWTSSHFMKLLLASSTFLKYHPTSPSAPPWTSSQILKLLLDSSAFLKRHPTEPSAPPWTSSSLTQQINNS